ncbi:hypothetical protein BCR34DRAFT_625347 [Clohesyomyces aquaticus]|uniref:SET domain-containing protein n=1 Tax=Clohesyomyces aquaticus TaxID=1231657 RepID=A0A1Y1ZJ12_9PLEO|nr:hypothetical protein BCR34DRAFT_625347 [Clohesyomyces aquaticus]
MGIDAGFDMVPPLSKNIVDRHNWDQFISSIKSLYRDDPQVDIEPNYILFKAGEYPKLPFEGHKFLRFSSKISGANARVTKVEGYITVVTRIAKSYFGSRVRYWDECVDQYGIYDWSKVWESIRSYEQVCGAEIPISLVPSITSHDPISELPLFEIENISHKGRGLVARCNISKGTRILCEKPLLTLRPMAPGDAEKVLATQLKALPKESQRQFLSLHNTKPGQHPFTGIVKTNALPCGPDSPIGGVYPTICLINHSCIPNSHHSWNNNTEQETIHAIRPIKAGEEITISYDRGGTSSVRRTFLKEAFDFDCHCHRCSLLTPELGASDARRSLIQSLDDAIGDPFRMASRPKDSLRDCSSLLQALRDEYDGCTEILSARAYYDAFQISIAHGDQARASQLTANVAVVTNMVRNNVTTHCEITFDPVEPIGNQAEEYMGQLDDEDDLG